MAHVSTGNRGAGFHLPDGEPENLYERFPWLYAFCRDHLFRNDTEKIVAALWPGTVPAEGSSLLDLGCGPGFYARRLAGRFEPLRVTGVDRSARQLRRARSLATALRLGNCSFEEGDVRALAWPTGSVDALVASRLFMVLSEPEQTVAEMYRVLKPGGRCFIAEPRSALRASVPLQAMRLLATLADFGGERGRRYRELGGVSVLDVGGFRALIQSQPWSAARHWQDTWYQYALCEKDPGRDDT